MNYTRNFIKNIEGFIRDNVYERIDRDGNLICIIITVWENEDAVNKAKEVVKNEYKKTGFNPAEIFSRLNITVDWGIYKERT